MDIQYVELDSDLPLGPVPCVVDGFWNGWAVPWFAWREVQEIGAELMVNRECAALTDGGSDEANSVWLEDGGELDRCEWRVFPDGVTRWNIGAGWRWLVVEE